MSYLSIHYCAAGTAALYLAILDAIEFIKVRCGDGNSTDSRAQASKI